MGWAQLIPRKSHRVVSATKLSDYAVIGLFVIAVFVVLQIAQNVFAPLLTAIVIGVFLGPAADKAEALGVPKYATALLVIFGFLACVIGLGLVLAGPISQFIDEAPRIIRRITQFVDGLKTSLDTLENIQERISEAMPGDKNGVVVETNEPQITDAISFAPTALGNIVIFLGCLFFFTMGRVDIYGAISRLADTSEKQARLFDVLRSTERTMSRYFLAITFINSILGLAVFAMTWAYGLASPALRGLLAFGLNYILFLGPLCMVIMLAVAGISAFSGIYALAPALTFVGFNLIEGQFATPGLVGRTLTLNPLLVFMSLVFGLWLWGPIGGFLAIPTLLIVAAFLKLESEAPDDSSPDIPAYSKV